jgi:hypothetical protein
MQTILDYFLGSATQIYQDQAVTANNNPSYKTIGKPHLDYYSGVTRQSNELDIIRLAQECIDSDLRLAVLTFFQKRDCRSGAGERNPFILSMAKVPESLRRRLYPLIPEYGYWKDLNKLARIIPNDQEYIATFFARHLLINMQNFPQGDRNLEKWLPTEKQHDSKNWHAITKIINAFNNYIEEPIKLKYNVVNTILEELKYRLAKINEEITVDYVMGGSLAITSEDIPDVKIIGDKYQHVLNKANNLPIVLTKLKPTGYRKWCSFVRAYYDVVEHFKSTDEWNLINYSKVPSIAFNRTKKQFAKHDEMRFQAFVESVKKGESKINISRLMPYELLEQESSEVRDEQWKLIVKEAREFYAKVDKDNIFRPENSIHVADTSASMTSIGPPKPIDVSLSLAFLMSEVSGKAMYTFSGTPKRYEPTWTSLTEAQDTVNDPNYNTNFRGVIDRIYDDCMVEADQKGVSPSEVIPSTIYIYTDGGFDQMCHISPITAIDYTKSKFEKFKKIPIIIFWNVAGNVKDFAVTTEHTGVVQIAGFSKDIYKIFTRLVSIEEINPEGFFRRSVLSERYQPILKIYNEWNEKS